jgi:hypothetical protein
VSTDGTKTTSRQPVICCVALLRLTNNEAHHAHVPLSPVENDLLDNFPFCVSGVWDGRGNPNVSTVGTKTTSRQPVICCVALPGLTDDDAHHTHVPLSPVENDLLDNLPFFVLGVWDGLGNPNVSTDGTKTTSRQPVVCCVALLRLANDDAHHAHVPLSPVENDLLDNLPFFVLGVWDGRGHPNVSTVGTKTTSPLTTVCCVASLGLTNDDAHHTHVPLSPVENDLPDNLLFCISGVWDGRGNPNVSTVGTKTTSRQPVVCCVASLGLSNDDAHHAHVPLSPVENDLLDNLPFFVSGVWDGRGHPNVNTVGTKTTSPLTTVCCVASPGLTDDDAHHAHVPLSPVENDRLNQSHVERQARAVCWWLNE